MKILNSQEITDLLGTNSLPETEKRKLIGELIYVAGLFLIDNFKDVYFNTTIIERPKGIEIICTSNKNESFHFGILFSQIIIWKITYTPKKIPVLVILGIHNNKDFKLLFKVKNYRKVEAFFDQLRIKKL